MSRKLVWFSCGAASACAAKLTLEQYQDAEVLYCDTLAYEHPDNRRFIIDVEKWIGREIKILKSEKYKDIFDVWRRNRFIVSPPPARMALCTLKLKRDVRESYQEATDVHYFGFTADEPRRIDRFIESNPELKLQFPLKDLRMTKQDCLDFLNKAGIKLPVMYRLGYKNNNCIGCVKGGKGYWNKIREDFPEYFSRMVELEDELGARVFVDTKLADLDSSSGRYDFDLDIECGPFCSVSDSKLNRDKLERTVEFLSENPGSSLRDLERAKLGYKKSQAALYKSEAVQIIRSSKNIVV